MVLEDTTSHENLTRHIDITDRFLVSLGENFSIQQALSHISTYDGKNQPLKTFLQDVENGLTICPEGIHPAFFKGVVSKLRGAARDVIGTTVINNIDTLKDTLKEHFAPKKDYSQYCAEIQGIRMRKNETVAEYYARLNHLVEGAKASLAEKFSVAQTPNMITMVKGIALESFKRGLPDDLLYAVSVKEPADLETARNIARRVERDMKGLDDRRGSLNVVTPEPTENRRREERSPDRRVTFQERTPWRQNYRDEGRNTQPGILNRNREAYRSPDRRSGSPSRYSNQSPNRNNSNYYQPPLYAHGGYMPPPYPFHPNAPMIYHPQGYMNPYGFAAYPQTQQYFHPQNSNNSPATQSRSGNLNYSRARQTDAPTSRETQARPPQVKLFTVEELERSQMDGVLPQ